MSTVVQAKNSSMSAANGTMNLEESKPLAQPAPESGEANPKPQPKEENKEGKETKKQPSGGHDETPLPRLSPGYTVRFTFHSASGLPMADLRNTSCDPYITATIDIDNMPTRHKQDPPMQHRSRTAHGTTEPSWQDEWVVANVPASGFRLTCRLYDEDIADGDDRLGVATVQVPRFSYKAEEKCFIMDHAHFDVHKRHGSKRAYLMKALAAILRGESNTTPQLVLSIEVLGATGDDEGIRLYTLGPTVWIRHFSPMIGRLVGTTVDADGQADGEGASRKSKESKKYDFQAIEIQLQGPVPPELYHRYVEFRPIIGKMFSARGFRGTILNKALHKQHSRVYNFSPSTEYGNFPPCSEQASLQFLKLVQFGDGGRMFTYMISLDGFMRFTETGKEFGIDLLSKHSMHSDVAMYIAYSGEFFIRHVSADHGEAGAGFRANAGTSIREEGSAVSGAAETGPGPGPGLGSGSETRSTPPHPSHYQLIIDNDSGTYRPDKACLPQLQAFLQRNFPGLQIRAMHWEDKKLQNLKEEQLKIKSQKGPAVQMVLNRNSSASSFSSSDESRLSGMGRHQDGEKPAKSKKEAALDILEDPRRLKNLREIL